VNAVARFLRDWIDTLGFAVAIAMVASLVLAAIALALSFAAQAESPARNAATPVMPPVFVESEAAPGTRNLEHWRELNRTH
jgi:hypothetical protein